ncbi:hypothetical protein MSG28_010136 [Choristoneura fumiferana]|uniref:Uncharacterized protein n=1 Tax=Choristoneura fumiferana TaxID=7141 RepID=A0ACC0KJG0_CHOFU|nr:hypothetical protein MSG28_010136 [Choristoneura fumiferana]
MTCRKLQVFTEQVVTFTARHCDYAPFAYYKPKARYQSLVGGSEPLQSYLHKRIAENLNSEAALGTVTDVAQCVEWLRSTFLYVRAAKDPKRYLGLPPAAPTHLILKKIEVPPPPHCKNTHKSRKSIYHHHHHHHHRFEINQSSSSEQHNRTPCYQITDNRWGRKVHEWRPRTEDEALAGLHQVDCRYCENCGKPVGPVASCRSLWHSKGKAIARQWTSSG